MNLYKWFSKSIIVALLSYVLMSSVSCTSNNPEDIVDRYVQAIDSHDTNDHLRAKDLRKKIIDSCSGKIDEAIMLRLESPSLSVGGGTSLAELLRLRVVENVSCIRSDEILNNFSLTSSSQTDRLSNHAEFIISDAIISGDRSLIKLISKCLAVKSKLQDSLILLANSATFPPEEVLSALLNRSDLSDIEYMYLQTLIYNLEDRDMNKALRLREQLKTANDPMIQKMLSFRNEMGSRNEKEE